MSTATTSPVLAKEPFLRAAGVCGLLALVTVSVGWIGGALAQPDAYSSADDDLSDLGALTANKAWIYNQIGDNLTGILILLGLGLWRALSPDVLGRIGAGAVMLTGLVVFLEGFFRLDCRGIDPGCTNESWHSSAHKMNNRFTVAATIAAPLILAFAFRRIPEWRGAWLPSLAAVPAALVLGVLFSVLGNGASVRATSLTLFAWLVFLAVRLMRTANARQVQTE